MADRAEEMQVRTIVTGQGTGGYKLSKKYLEIDKALADVRAIEIREAARVYAEGQGEHVADVVGAGEELSGDRLTELAREVEASRRERAVTDIAVSIKQSAVEALADRSVNVFRSGCEEIVTETLRAAFERVLAEAREIAEAVRAGGFVLTEPAGLLNANERIRKGALRFQEIAGQLQVLQASAVACARLAQWQCAQDVNGRFAAVEFPELLVPGWEPGKPFKPPEISNDPVEHLAWLVGAGWSALPWLPTPMERDERFLDTFPGPNRAGVSIMEPSV